MKNKFYIVSGFILVFCIVMSVRWVAGYPIFSRSEGNAATFVAAIVAGGFAVAFTLVTIQNERHK